MRALGYFQIQPDAPRGHAAAADALLRKFNLYCANQRHTAIATFQEALGDVSRPEYERMVLTIRSTKLPHLIVIPSIDHLGGSIEDQVERVLELDALGCPLVCSDVLGDPVKAALQLWEKSAFSSAARRQKIMDGMRAKAARALGLGKPPYGYRVLVTGAIEPVPEEAKIVKMIYGLYLEQDIGVRTIARTLNEQGIKTRRRKLWSMVTVRDILRNNAYVGTYRRFGLRIPRGYEPIISNDDFRRALEKMQARSPVRKNPKGEPFLLSGLLYCGECGQRMMGVTRRQSWQRKDGARTSSEYRYYQCQSKTNRSQCQYHTQRANDLEKVVVAKVRLMAASNGHSPTIVPEHDPAKEHERESPRLKAIERRYVEAVRKIVTGNGTLRQLRTSLAEPMTERRAVLGRLSLVNSGPSLNGHNGLRHIDEWETLDTPARRSLLHGLVTKVTIKDKRIDVEAR